MPVGIGAGFNLGSATIYLFADASGMRRGLHQAQRETEAFQNRLAKRNGAQATLDIATKSLEKSQGLMDTKNSQKFVDLQRQATNQVLRTSEAIRQSYQERNKAATQHGNVVRNANRALEQQEGRLKAITQQRIAVERELAAAKRANAGKNATAGGEAKIIALTKELARLEKIEATKTSNLTRDRLRADALIADSARQKNAIIEAANKREEQSIARLRSAINNQVNSYRQLAQDAGPQYTKLANAVEAAGKRMIVAEQRLANAREVADNARKARQASGLTTGAEYDKLIYQEQRANRAVQAARNERIRARRNMEQAERNFTVKLQGEVNQRIAAVDKETARVKAAIAAEEAARKEAARGAADRLLSSSTALTAGMVATVKSAATQWGTYEEALRNALAISEELRPNFDEAKNAIDDLSVSLGKAPADIAEGFGVVAQAGITDFNDAMELTTQGTKLAVAGMTDVESAVRPLIGVMNAYGKEAFDVQEVSDKLFKAVTDGVFSFEELTGQLGDNLSIASSLGIELDELLSSYVILTRRSNSLSESTTQINGIMNSFLKPTEALNAAMMDYADTTAQAFIQSADFGDVLQFVSEQFEENADNAAKLFPNIRALRGIFGLTADEAKAFDQELDTLRNHAEGTTFETMEYQMQGFAFQMRQAGESARQAGISLGSALTPGILLVAGAVASAAGYFARFNDALEGIPGMALGGLAAILALGFVVARTVVAFISIKDAIGKVNDSLKIMAQRNKAAAASSRLLTAAMSPWGLLATGLAIGIGVLIARHREQQQAVRDLKKAYQELDTTIRGLFEREDLTREEAQAWADLAWNVDFANDAVVRAQDALQNTYEIIGQDGGTVGDSNVFQTLADGTFRWATAIDEAGNVIRYNQGSMQDFINFIELGEIGTNSFGSALSDLNEIIIKEGLDVRKVADYLGPFIENFLSGVPGSAGALDDAIQHVSENMGLFRKESEETANAIATVGKSLVNVEQFFGTAEEQADALRTAFKGFSDQARLAANDLPNLNSPLEYIQQQIGQVGQTTNETFVALDRLGHIDLSQAEREGLEAAAAVDYWKGKIDEVNASFAESDTVIQNWQGIMQRTTDVVGTSTDGFDGLNDMLERGKITEQEYQDIKEATIYLQESAKIGIDNERVAIAKALPDLAAFVQEHEIAADAYKLLTPEQRGFAEAIKDTTNQTILLTAVMLKLANAMNKDVVPDEFLNEFIRSVAIANPAAAALLDTLNLIPESVKTELEVVMSDGVADAAADTIDEVKKQISDAQTDLGKVFRGGWGNPFSEEDYERTRKRLELLNEKKILLEMDMDTTQVDKQLAELDSGIEDTEQAADELGNHWDDIFDEMEKTPGEVEGSLAELIQSTIEAVGATDDYSDALATLNRQLGITDGDILDVLQRMDQLDRGVELSIDERDALRAAIALRDVEREIEGIEGAIQNNSEDMGMWQGRIDLVNELFDVSEEKMAEWNAQLAAGTITQEQYWALVMSGDPETALTSLNDLVADGTLTQKEADDILKAGLWIRERSIGALADEREEQLRLLPALQQLIEKHDVADGVYEDLDDSQKQWIAGLSQENVMLALQTALLLAQMNALGQLSDEKYQQGLIALANSDQAIGAFFIELGLVEDTDNDGIIDKVKSDVEDTEAVMPIVLGPGEPGNEGGTDTTTTTPSGSEREPTTTTIEVDADTSAAEGELKRFNTQVVADSRETGSDYSQGISQGIGGGGGAIQGSLAAIQTGRFIPFIDQANKSGYSAGDSYDTGIANAILNQMSKVRNATGGVTLAMDSIAGGAWQSGHYVGSQFDAGVAAGINEGTLATGAARYLAQRIDAALRNTLGIESPSKKGQFAGEMLIAGLALGIVSKSHLAEQEARNAGLAASSALQDGLTKTSLRSMPFGGAMSAGQTAPATFPVANGQMINAGSSAMTINITQNNTFNGVGADIGAIENAIFTSLNRAVDRARAAGQTGR